MYMFCETPVHIIRICSGITCGRVLNGEPYAQRLQKLIYLHLFRTVSRKQSSEQIQTSGCFDDWREIFMRQSVK